MNSISKYVRWKNQVFSVSSNNEQIYKQPSFIKAVDERLIHAVNARGLTFPAMVSTKTIALFSDYGGSEPGSVSDTYSFLLCSYDMLHEYASCMKHIRKKYRLHYQEIKYTKRKYCDVYMCLKEMTNQASSLIEGFLLTIIVDKRIKSLYNSSSTGKHELAVDLAKNGYGIWKQSVSERMYRIVHIGAYIVALMARNGHNVPLLSQRFAVAQL